MLKNAGSVREASDLFLTIFERPADQGESVRQRRAGYGNSFLQKFE